MGSATLDETWGASLRRRGIRGSGRLRAGQPLEVARSSGAEARGSIPHVRTISLRLSAGGHALLPAGHARYGGRLGALLLGATAPRSRISRAEGTGRLTTAPSVQGGPAVRGRDVARTSGPPTPRLAPAQFVRETSGHDRGAGVPAGGRASRSIPRGELSIHGGAAHRRPPGDRSLPCCAHRLAGTPPRCPGEGRRLRVTRGVRYSTDPAGDFTGKPRPADPRRDGALLPQSSSRTTTSRADRPGGLTGDVRLVAGRGGHLRDGTSTPPPSASSARRPAPARRRDPRARGALTYDSPSTR